MPLSAEEHDELRRLEESLWRAETFDRRMEDQVSSRHTRVRSLGADGGYSWRVKERPDGQAWVDTRAAAPPRLRTSRWQLVKGSCYLFPNVVGEIFAYRINSLSGGTGHTGRLRRTERPYSLMGTAETSHCPCSLQSGDHSTSLA